MVRAYGCMHVQTLVQSGCRLVRGVLGLLGLSGRDRNSSRCSVLSLLSFPFSKLFPKVSAPIRRFVTNNRCETSTVYFIQAYSSGYVHVIVVCAPHVKSLMDAPRCYTTKLTAPAPLWLRLRPKGCSDWQPAQLRVAQPTTTTIRRNSAAMSTGRRAVQQTALTESLVGRIAPRPESARYRGRASWPVAQSRLFITRGRRHFDSR
jgi:hypothetical protein